MNITFIDFFTIVAITHCFILSLVILLSKFFRNDTNKYLGFTLLIIAIVGINNWFWDLNKSPMITSLLDLFLWQFLYPVTFFVFFYNTSHPSIVKKGSKLKWLYLPFIVLSILNIFISLDTIFKLYDLSGAINVTIPYFYKTVSFLSVVFPLIIIWYSYKYTFLKGNNLSEKWLKRLWIFVSIIFLYGSVLEGYRFIYSEKPPLTYLWSFASILVYWLIYKGLYQFKLANDQYEIREILKKHSVNKQLYAETKENPNFNKLKNLFETEHIHRLPNLSRDMVAEKLDISSGYLSQIVKQHTNLSFSDLVNSYRIEDAKRMIKDPSFNKYSLLSIGMECGFNSKTSFFVNFKKETQLTPKQFRDQ